MEIVIRLIYLLLFAFWQTAYAYDTIEVLHKGIAVARSGYTVSDQNISANEAYALFAAKKFKELPKRAKSFGFDTKSYWYAFSVSIDAHPTEKYYLDIRSLAVDRCEFYTFKNGNLLKSELSGSLIPESQRPIKEFPARFALSESNGEIIYLLKIDTKAPRLSAFAFGMQNEIDETWNIHSFIFALATGMTLFVVFFTLVFYANVKDRIYLFYMLYIFGLYGSIIITSGHAQPLVQLLVVLFLQAQLVGLTLFSEQLLNTHSYIPKFALFIRYLLYINIVLSLAFPISPLFKALSFLMSVMLFTALLLAAFKILTRAYKIIFYYLIATGAALILMIAFTLMHQGVIPYTIVSSNFLTLALIWDMTFLSLAIGHRIALIQHENMEKERILTLKSRQDTLGELTGNVAHQWRSPLSKIGIIVSTVQAKLIYSEISKPELLEYLTRVSTILKHLSNTVDTFQSFLVSKDKQENFDLTQSLEDIIHWIEPSFETETIELRYTFEPECWIRGEQNEILQTLLAIIQNSKEALHEFQVKHGYIHITLSKNPTYVTITIKDNGGGIKLMPISKVFDPYVSTKENGTGIGLLLAKTIIEKRHNGKLSVKNEDQGALFTIELATQ